MEASYVSKYMYEHVQMLQMQINVSTKIHLSNLTLDLHNYTKKL